MGRISSYLLHKIKQKDWRRYQEKSYPGESVPLTTRAFMTAVRYRSQREDWEYIKFILIPLNKTILWNKRKRQASTICSVKLLKWLIKPKIICKQKNQFMTITISCYLYLFSIKKTNCNYLELIRTS